MHYNVFYLKKPKLASLRLRDHLGRPEESLQAAPTATHMIKAILEYMDRVEHSEPLGKLR